MASLLARGGGADGRQCQRAGAHRASAARGRRPGRTAGAPHPTFGLGRSAAHARDADRVFLVSVDSRTATGQIERFLAWNFRAALAAAGFVFVVWLLYPWPIALYMVGVVSVSSAERR